MRSNSSGDLYSLPPSHSKPSPTSSALLSYSPDLWHRRLAHINKNSLHSLASSNSIACNKDSLASSCKACQLGKQIKLPLRDSNSYASKPFELINSDVWTSPIASPSNIRYYVLFPDDHTHFLWVYPLRRKSEVFSKFKQFSNYVETHFHACIQDVQCDNGGEYDNHQFQDYCDAKGMPEDYQDNQQRNLVSPLSSSHGANILGRSSSCCSAHLEYPSVCCYQKSNSLRSLVPQGTNI